MHPGIPFHTLRRPLTSKNNYRSAPQCREELRKDLQTSNNFRDVCVYPTKEDFIDGFSPSLRPNVVKGSYKDVEQYLDIHFHLMREDLLIPLREGISKLRRNFSNSKNALNIDNVKIYNNVKFGNPIIVGDKLGHIVHIASGKSFFKKQINSKKLIYGSLVLFTNDNFCSIICATVLGRTQNDVAVQIYHEGDQTASLKGKFLMIESDVYFEPYKHVLNALKNLNENNFPMQKYIVSSKMDSKSPQYLLRSSDYGSLFTLHCIYGQVVNILDKTLPNSKNLDDSQFKAFQAALSQEFVVIQGPPGTGKTFVGLQIIEKLLNNYNLWNKERCPLLVVCHTNHALDQFLEGILKVNKRIVRIGGQSKSDALKEYNITELRRKFGTKGGYFSMMSEVMKSMKTELSNLTELDKQCGIVSPNTFKKYGVVSGSSVPKDDKELLQWLFRGFQEYMHSPLRERYDDSEDEEENELDENIGLNGEKESEEVEDDGGTEVNDEILKYDLNDYGHDIDYSINFKKSKHLKRDELRYLKHWLNKRESCDLLAQTKDIWRLQTRERWTLYKNWVDSLKNIIREKMSELGTQYNSLSKSQEEFRNKTDLAIIRNVLVVGMTTSCAARLHTLLQSLMPKIVIVEEAAEVLESHILVSLTKSTEHLILIGDHKQLQPSVGTHKLANDYHLNVSLFERMINNGMQCYCLENQHRMRPEISALIAPSIYPKLKNHPSVYRYPHVKGVARSVFFITHNNKEEKENDSTSPTNEHEAEFLIALCKYLLCQGYRSEEITILSPYNKQLEFLRRKQREIPLLKCVHVTSIDNYQGEESKIILLSLVRSNPSATIGFLKNENRICVALSRAREGLYIIGNMENLIKSSSLWSQIKISLMKQNAFGTYLTLQCQNHWDQKTIVKCKADFRKVEGGGCCRPCLAKMECGDLCELKCHMANVNHYHKTCKRNSIMGETWKQSENLRPIMVSLAIACIWNLNPITTMAVFCFFVVLSSLFSN